MYLHSTCSLFTKNKEKIHKLIQTGNRSYICRNDLDKACFQRDMAYVVYKNLTKRTEPDKVLKDKAFNPKAGDPKYDGYEGGLTSMAYRFFDKKSAGSGINSMLNQQVANVLLKPIIRKFKRRKAHFSFKDNIWEADLADMRSISKYNNEITFLLRVIDIFSKYPLFLMHFKVY